MSMETNSEELTYWYVTFAYNGGIGNWCVTQKQLDEAGQEVDDLNIAGCHDYFINCFRLPVALIQWHQISKRRYDQCFAYFEKIGRMGGNAQNLTCHQGGKKYPLATVIQFPGKDPEKPN
jgi:hypothetical protein